MSLSAKTVYLDVSPIDWDKDGAKIAAWVWTGSDQGSWAGGTYMTKLANGFYKAEVGDNKNIKFVRLDKEAGDKPDWNKKWNETGNIEIPSDKDLYQMTKWSEGAWFSRTFTVTGVEKIFGTGWDASDANNDMVMQEDGTYKWEKEVEELGITDYAYKVVLNHSWKPELMVNQTIKIEKSGAHKITIIYNANENLVNATATLTKEEEVDPVMKIAGSFFERVNGNWAIKDLTVAEDKQTASIKITMTAGDYDFKVIKDGSWLGNDGTMTRGNCAGWTFEGDKGNAKITADVTGEYTFTWTYEGDKLSVTYPSSTPTAISNDEAESAPVKRIQNGQVVIVREGVTYNMMGQAIE